MPPIVLERVEVENLRGFYKASLSIDRPRTLIVGPNNSGKTSILRLLDWAVNRVDEDVLMQRRSITRSEQDLLLPARETRHRARRLQLALRLTDRRSWRKFGCDATGRTTLRLNIRLTPRLVVYAALGTPTRGEKAESDDTALELLKRFHDAIRFVHIPSFRDARSERFVATLQEALRSRIEEKALHASQAGAPKEHRDVARSLDTLRNVVLELAQPLWNRVSAALPPGMAREAKLTLDLDQSKLLTFLESRLRLHVSTGPHDALAVPMTELGSGLQSLLDLALQEREVDPDVLFIIAVEEPEAFLHPAPLRTISAKLFTSTDVNRRVIVTTHSPVVVEEAEYGDVVLCRRHQFYEPSTVSEERKTAISTALLSGFGAEMMFGSAILLVEGEGDRQFFERLRRRVARFESNGELDTCFVVPVGGKTRFGPWMMLLNSYGIPANRPIRWLVVADADASSDVRTAFLRAGITLRQDVIDDLGAVAAAATGGNIAESGRMVQRANRRLNETETRLQFLELDLEEAALSAAGDDLLRGLCRTAELQEEFTREEVLARLGAKRFAGRDGKKAPFIRGYIGERIRPSEVSANIRGCLARWFALAVGRERASHILTAWVASEP